MNSPETNLQTPRGWLRRFFSWKTPRRFLCTVGGLVALVVIFVGVEDWHGAREWRACKAALEAKGEVLDLNKLIPPPIPDDQNFCATPLLREIFTTEAANEALKKAGSTNWIVPRINRISLISSDPRDYYRNVPLEDLANIDGWAKYYRGNTNFPQAAASATPAEVVLTALGKFKPELDELHAAAAKRSRSQLISQKHDTDNPYLLLFPIEWFSYTRELDRFLLLHANANLAAGNNDEALDDLKPLFSLADANEGEPYMVSHIIGVSMLNLDMTVIQDGLASHAWSNRQLAEIQQRLLPLNLIAGCKHMLQAERACSLGILDKFAHASWKDRRKYMLLSNDILGGLETVAPRGWADYNKVTVCRWDDGYWAAIDENDMRIHVKAVDRLGREESNWTEMSRAEKLINARRMTFAWEMMQSFQRAIQRIAQGQTLLDEACVACALERYRIAHGAFPDSLDVLAPSLIAKLPHDIINGEPLKYRREGTSGYVLYSVGWNETDDGGKVVMDDHSTSIPDITKGDWVWSFPPTPAK